MGIFSRWQRKEQDSAFAKATADKKRQVKVGAVEVSATARSVALAKLPTATAADSRILIRPLITEKGARLKAANQYLFEVSRAANKISVARAVEQRYGAKPAKVNILNVAGKSVRYGRMVGQRKFWKKAVVVMPAGKELPVYQGV